MQIPKHQVAETAEDIGVENITKTPTGDAFVKPHLEKVGQLELSSTFQRSSSIAAMSLALIMKTATYAHNLD